MSIACNRFIVCVVLICWSPGSVIGQDTRFDLDETALEIARLLDAAVERETILGAQLAVGTGDSLKHTEQFGFTSPQGTAPVNAGTLFCIGSCSKPFASACIMSLVDAGQLGLDDRIDRWLPQFAQAVDLQGNLVSRAPTMRELLAHRGGIYSQKRDISAVQVRAIRDFRQTLAESVAVIGEQPLLSPPGSEYAYSGAGYCILGHVAEKATEASMESLLQDHVCKPLQMARTTFFPKDLDRNVAEGGVDTGVSTERHPDSPHLLGNELKFPLVGGSVYSTAEETGRLAQLILRDGKSPTNDVVLSQDAISQLTQRQFDDQTYGLGWSLPQVNNGETICMVHNGALYSYRSMIYVNLADSFYAVIHWTLMDPGSDEIRPQLAELLLRRSP